MADLQVFVGYSRIENDKENIFKREFIESSSFLFYGIHFFIMELTRETANIYTIVRWFVVIGGIDVGIESISLWFKTRMIE